MYRNVLIMLVCAGIIGLTTATRGEDMELTPPTKSDVGDPKEVAVIETDLGKITIEFSRISLRCTLPISRS